MILCHHVYIVPKDRRSLTEGRRANFYGSSMGGARRSYRWSVVHQGTRRATTSCVMRHGFLVRTVSRTYADIGNDLTPLDYLL